MPEGAVAAKIEITKADPYDAYELEPHLSTISHIELQLGENPIPSVDALVQCILASEECWTGRVDGEVALIFGVADDKGNGVPWMIPREDLIAKVRFRFLQMSRAFVDLWLEKWPVLSNFVPVRHEAAVTWLKGMGFSMSEPFEDFLQSGEPFYLFFKESSPCVNPPASSQESDS